jgi:hypothetical protein
MMAPLCDDATALLSTYANLTEVRRLTTSLASRNLSAKFSLRNCTCCSIIPAGASSAIIRVCNRKHVDVLVSYAVVGITAQSIIEEPACVRGDDGVRGAYVWDSRWDGMRFSLYVGGRDSSAAGLADVELCKAWMGKSGFSLTELVPVSGSGNVSVPSVAPRRLPSRSRFLQGFRIAP